MKKVISKYISGYSILKDNPRDYWIVQLVNFLESMSYFAMMAVLVIFLSDTIGWNDIHAGYIVTAFSLTVGILLPVSGFIIDYLGIRKSMLLALVILTTARILIVVFGLFDALIYREWFVVIALIIVAVGMSIMLPCFQAANRRFSSVRSQSASFGLWYLVMNLGGIPAGFLVDYIRLNLGLDSSYIFVLGAILALTATITTSLLIRKIPIIKKSNNNENTIGHDGIIQGVISVVSETAFKKLMVLVIILLGVRSIVMYLVLLFPKYWIRLIGEKAEIGFLQSVNYTLVVIGLILIIPITSRFKLFNMLIFGALISAMSLLMLVIPYQYFSDNISTAYFYMSVCMLVLFALGEVVWSPKLNEYTAAIAPKGQEGSYFGLSMVPWFLAKLVVGILSGHLLLRYVPENVSELVASGNLSFWDSPQWMFAMLFFAAVIGPAIAYFYKDWFTVELRQ